MNPARQQLGAAGADGALASNHPLGFRNLTILYPQPQRRDVGRLTFLDQPEIRGLPADRIEKLPLNIAQRRDRLPGARSRANHHAVVGLPEADEQRSRAGVMLHHGVQILVERCLQTRAVARLCGRDARRERSDQKKTGRMH